MNRAHGYNLALLVVLANKLRFEPLDEDHRAALLWIRERLEKRVA